MASAEDGAEYSPRVPVDQSDTGHGLGNSSTPRLSGALDLEGQRESAEQVQETCRSDSGHDGA
jgi:hypothetical protein